jgi:molybdopterin-guanine dinucleotide biosynthesis protein A
MQAKMARDDAVDSTIGLVLAGGIGRRLGRTKGDLRVGGRPLALRAAETLASVCRGVLVSVGPGAENPAPGYPAVEDDPPAGRGPLAGIDAAFARTGEADLMVLACDYPRVMPALLRRLLERADRDAALVLVRDGKGRDHPLVALWRLEMQARVRDALRRGAFRVADLVGASAAQRLGPDVFPGIDLERELANVNRPGDLDRLDDPP